MKARTYEALVAVPREKLWALWADVTTWPSWDEDKEKVEVPGGWRMGAPLRMKLKDGPWVEGKISQWLPGQAFTDVSAFPLGTKLTFDHELVSQGGQTLVRYRFQFTGPLGWLFDRILGRKFQAELPVRTDRLVKLASQS